ncbi:histidine biosynthesis bifunctional protein hisIE, chloroplastic-like [Asparagus officinalis]|uniref:histidine biosynthesis bifunctional protein hisIE, chloroplastic-like n=1 Tax=Asparagus officinalis TaxID=4686 RepID=UPI00098E8118|nr:histidine biosynthesis bifunctional protein hisIE, chloroplastic-like [Asparagus officinalis]
MAAASFARLSSLSFSSRDGIKTPRKPKVFRPIRASSSSPPIELRFDPKKVECLLDSVKWDEKGLAVAIAQNVDTGAILMQGFANREALAATISSQKATFYSRSRSSLWTKGETSMNFINVKDIFLDCDRDSIVYLGKPDGPTCHTGAETCYYSSVADLLEEPQTKKERLASTTLYSLESTIFQRKAEIETTQNGKPSWTKKLLSNEQLLCSKILSMLLNYVALVRVQIRVRGTGHEKFAKEKRQESSSRR